MGERGGAKLGGHLFRLTWGRFRRHNRHMIRATGGLDKDVALDVGDACHDRQHRLPNVSGREDAMRGRSGLNAQACRQPLQWSQRSIRCETLDIYDNLERVTRIELKASGRSRLRRGILHHIQGSSPSGHGAIRLLLEVLPHLLVRPSLQYLTRRVVDELHHYVEFLRRYAGELLVQGTWQIEREG